MAGITTITPTQSRPDTDSCGMKLTLTGTQSGFSSTLDLRPISIKPSYRHGRDDCLMGNTQTMRSAPYSENAESWDYTSKVSSGSGSLSPGLAHHTYRVGKTKMLIARLTMSPPTITIAKGRCESEPMACDKAAGSKPRVATSIVIKMGRSRSTAPSIAECSIG